MNSTYPGEITRVKLPPKLALLGVTWGAGLFLIAACGELFVDHQRFTWAWAVSGLAAFMLGGYLREWIRWRRQQSRLVAKFESGSQSSDLRVSGSGPRR
jgi:predicted alpha/beta hydrolase